ncbi:MAG: regulatory protein RecX [Gammaproteobacteria bacterium]|nr:regulatory protein RecX [Gammaproteobacteria bacterium]
MTKAVTAEAYQRAMRFLVLREHSGLELSRKLTQIGFSKEIIETVLQRLISEGYQSDKRYAEAYLKSRSDRGYGPLAIARDLKERGVDQTIIESIVVIDELHWQEQAGRVRSKKFGGNLPSTLPEKAKQYRFLQYRGFTEQQIAITMKKLAKA